MPTAIAPSENISRQYAQAQRVAYNARWGGAARGRCQQTNNSFGLLPENVLRWI